MTTAATPTSISCAMAPTKPSKKLLKKLKRSNFRVEKPSGVTYHVTPVQELRDRIERFLPPAGHYYDQSVLEKAFNTIDHQNICALCWNANIADKKCICKKKCILCGTKQHRGTECRKVYASIKWWQSHGHHLRKKAQLRPNPGERAYLIIAGVFEEGWRRLEDPVVVNMEHPAVKAFYKGKKAPCASTELPQKLRPTPAAATAQPSTELDVGEASPATGHGTDVDTTPISICTKKHSEAVSPRGLNASTVIVDETTDIEGRSQTLPFSAEDDSFLDELLEDTWQPSSYHEGSRLATVTPLRMRLAIYNAQQFTITPQSASFKSGIVRSDRDPRLQSRAAVQDTASVPQSPLTGNAPHSHVDGAKQGRMREDKRGDIREELQKAREELKAKDRRIRELELALHESEGWTDAVTYRGQKRSRA
jgi:hypothetical protein